MTKMIDLPNYNERWNRKPEICFRLAAALAAAFIMLETAGPARGQVAPTADVGGFRLSAGVTGSGEYVQYGQRKMVAASPFVDFDNHRNLGIEAEAHFVQFHQTSNLHFNTYSIGVRYRFNFERWQPYAKGLAGFGDFNFPYNYATGRYLVITAGGGIDYRFNSRIHFRVADGEWQYWPGVNCGASGACGAMSSLGVSAVLKFNIP
jgi:hypothetical protein